MLISYEEKKALYLIDKEKMLLSYKPLACVGKSYALLGEEIAVPKIP